MKKNTADLALLCENAEDNALEAQIEKSDQMIDPSSGLPGEVGVGVDSDGVI